MLTKCIYLLIVMLIFSVSQGVARLIQTRKQTGAVEEDDWYASEPRRRAHFQVGLRDGRLEEVNVVLVL